MKLKGNLSNRKIHEQLSHLGLGSWIFLLDLEDFEFLIHTFVQTLRVKCFDKCITKPGSSLSGSESSCISRCMERYIEATSIVSKALFKTPHWKVAEILGGDRGIFGNLQFFFRFLVWYLFSSSSTSLARRHTFDLRLIDNIWYHILDLLTCELWWIKLSFLLN